MTAAKLEPPLRTTSVIPNNNSEQLPPVPGPAALLAAATGSSSSYAGPPPPHGYGGEMESPDLPPLPPLPHELGSHPLMSSLDVSTLPGGQQTMGPVVANFTMDSPRDVIGTSKHRQAEPCIAQQSQA